MKLWALYVFCFLFGLNVRNRKYRKQGGKKSHILKPGEHISHTLILTTLSSSVAKTYCMPRPLYCTVILSFVSTNAYTHPQMHADRKEFLLMLTANLLSASTATASKGLFAPPRPNEMDNYGKCHCNKKGFTDTVKQHSFLKSCYSQTSDF